MTKINDTDTELLVTFFQHPRSPDTDFQYVNFGDTDFQYPSEHGSIVDILSVWSLITSVKTGSQPIFPQGSGYV